MPRNFSVCSAVAISAVLLASGCTQGGGATAPVGDSLRLGLTTDVSTFDPIKSSSAGDYLMNRLMYSPLVGIDDGNVAVPRLAARWDVTANGATFVLKKGVSCSDGSPLTAGQVAASLERYRARGSATGQTFGPDNSGDKTTITADDAAGTVTITLANPWGELLTGLGQPATSIVCASGLAAGDALAAGNVDGAGTGPYVLTRNERGTSYDLTLRDGFDAYPQFHNLPGGVPAKTLRLSIVKNESTLANQLQTGELDYGSFTGPDAARFDGGGFTTMKAPVVRYYLTFNERPGHPGADPQLRRAIAQALDPQAFAKVFGVSASPLASYVESGTTCANTDTALLVKPDVAAAKSRLSGVSIRVVGTNAVAQGAGNDYVAEALRVAGAEVTLNNADNATWAGSVLPGGDWDVNVMASVFGSLLIGAQQFSGAQPPSGRNYGGVDNKEFTGEYGAAVRTVDAGAKCASWQRAQAALLRAVDTMPLSTVDVSYVFRKGVSAATPTGAIEFATLRIAR